MDASPPAVVRDGVVSRRGALDFLAAPLSPASSSHEASPAPAASPAASMLAARGAPLRAGVPRTAGATVLHPPRLRAYFGPGTGSRRPPAAALAAAHAARVAARTQQRIAPAAARVLRAVASPPESARAKRRRVEPFTTHHAPPTARTTTTVGTGTAGKLLRSTGLVLALINDIAPLPSSPLPRPRNPPLQGVRGLQAFLPHPAAALPPTTPRVAPSGSTELTNVPETPSLGNTADDAFSRQREEKVRSEISRLVDDASHTPSRGAVGSTLSASRSISRKRQYDEVASDNSKQVRHIAFPDVKAADESAAAANSAMDTVPAVDTTAVRRSAPRRGFGLLDDEEEDNNNDNNNNQMDAEVVDDRAIGDAGAMTTGAAGIAAGLRREKMERAAERRREAANIVGTPAAFSFSNEVCESAAEDVKSSASAAPTAPAAVAEVPEAPASSMDADVEYEFAAAVDFVPDARCSGSLAQTVPAEFVFRDSVPLSI